MLTKEELQKALNGHPVMCEQRGIGYITESQADQGYYILDFPFGLMRVEKSKIMEMDINLHALKFEDWDLIHSRFTKLKKTLDDRWEFFSKDSALVGIVFDECDFIDGLFPKCPIGTVIYRPEEA